jgi:hypothetical protein
MEENVTTKKCTKCGRELPVADFFTRIIAQRTDIVTIASRVTMNQ